jgi:hypothetical protein
MHLHSRRPQAKISVSPLDGNDFSTCPPKSTLADVVITLTTRQLQLGRVILTIVATSPEIQTWAVIGSQLTQNQTAPRRTTQHTLPPSETTRYSKDRLYCSGIVGNDNISESYFDRATRRTFEMNNEEDDNEDEQNSENGSVGPVHNDDDAHADADVVVVTSTPSSTA